MTKRQTVADDLRAQISSGKLAEGAVLPSEPELAALHKVSRDTVRWALKDLEGEGLVITRHGRFGGRYVREHKPLELDLTIRDTATWRENIAGLGRASVTTVKVDDPDGDPLVRRWWRDVDGRPHSLGVLRFPADVAKGTLLASEIDIEEGAVEHLKEAQGWAELTETATIGARMPTPGETRELRIPPGVPVMVERWTGTRGSRVVYESERILPADWTLFRLHF